ncbi:unnamed protein product [Periconia digitata]|uniref:Ras modification protein ERF4 n=1 Tax=Periconia digitata TaxID=1303443 RepID=A0A9W4UCM0_9PLEO|nr:unnamed protein product [Periconia digitata]
MLGACLKPPCIDHVGKNGRPRRQRFVIYLANFGTLCKSGTRREGRRRGDYGFSSGRVEINHHQPGFGGGRRPRRAERQMACCARKTSRHDGGIDCVGPRYKLGNASTNDDLCLMRHASLPSSLRRHSPLCLTNHPPPHIPSPVPPTDLALSQQSTELPARWSITNRLFNFNPFALYNNSPPRPKASRLWNPVNSSPRTLAVQHHPPPPHLDTTLTRDAYTPNVVPVQRPDTRDEYPLLNLPPLHHTSQSPAPSSLFVERSTGDTPSGRTSIALPRDRRSLHPPSHPHSPMAVEHAAADEPAARRSNDPEVGLSLRPSLTRVSLPSRPNSLHSGEAAHDGDGDDDESEFTWGPSHPCYPHPNPHVPLDTELYENTRIIRVKRDWMLKGDLAPTFTNMYPEILDPIITEDQFRTIVQKINNTLVDAFDPFSFKAWMDSLMGVATFWLWDDAGLTNIKRKLAELEAWLEAWNKETGEQEGVRIIPLRRTGYLTLDIQIPDPHLGPVTGTTRPNTNEEESQPDPAAQKQQQQQQSQQIGQLPYPFTPTLQVNPSSPLALGAQA